MTVSMQLTKRIYAGNGLTRAWEVDFPLTSAEDLQVFLTSPAGYETRINADYELNSAMNSLTYPTVSSGKDPLATGWKITLVRQTPSTQEIDLLRQGELDAEVLEQGYDKLTLITQELAEKLDRCIKYPVSSQPENLETDTFLANILEAKQDAITASSQAATAAQSAQQSAVSATQTAQTASSDIAQAKQTALSDLTSLAQSLQTALESPVGTVQTSLSNKADLNLSNLSNAGKIVSAHLAMPSTTTASLTIGADGTTYTAPADGYFNFRGQGAQSDAWAYIGDNSSYQNCAFQSNAVTGQWIVFTLTVRKDEIIVINYGGLQNLALSFIYANGATSEAN